MTLPYGRIQVIAQCNQILKYNIIIDTFHYHCCYNAQEVYVPAAVGPVLVLWAKYWGVILKKKKPLTERCIFLLAKPVFSENNAGH